MEKTINETEVKKDLYKSKVNAKFSHYASGNLFYTVELADGIYQFPISTIDTGTLSEIDERELVVNDIEEGGTKDFDKQIFNKEDVDENYVLKSDAEEVKFTKLSADLGITPFASEVKASELNRWIAKAIKKEEFIKIN